MGTCLYCALLLTTPFYMMPLLSQTAQADCQDSNEINTDNCTSNDKTSNIVSEWGLKGDRELLAALPDTFLMTGYALGSLVGSPLPDIIGRKKAVVALMCGLTSSTSLLLASKR